MAELRGTDLVVEYLIREKVPYLFGYAGHGAVGLLDGVFDRQDEIKVVFPRIETGAAYMADAYYRVSHEVIPVYTSTGPGPMLLSNAGGDVELPPEPVTNVVDTTAAGDAFNAGYLAARMLGLDPRQAARTGSALSAVVIRHPGAVIPRAAMPSGLLPES